MIDYTTRTLDNGLRIYFHQDQSVTTVAINLIYNVGSRDEDENKTGFAHLFEHLMFGGSVNIPSYDEPLQAVGGENNAFTSPDITNYYLTLPAVNFETGLWLESDRMLSLSFDPEVLEVQRKVVIEEFNQRYLNQPYGDVWLKMRPLIYKNHPYKWATIGKNIQHIEEATMEDVKSFFAKHYVPANAVLVVAGNFEVEDAFEKVSNWFGSIPAKPAPTKALPTEPQQTEKRTEHVVAEVPASAVYLAFHAPARFHNDFHTSMMLGQWLGYGKSSALYQELVVKEQLFSSISAGVMGSHDPGLLVIEGKLRDGISPEQGEEAIWKVIGSLLQNGISDDELLKIKNQAETALAFEEIDVLNRAMNLAYFALYDRADEVNKEGERIQAVTSNDLNRLATELLQPNKSSVLYYQKAEAVTV